METMPLRDRVALVTGGSSGIGRGICLELAREGARVVVADLQEEPKRGKLFERDTVTPTVAEVEKLGSEGLFIKADVSKEADVERFVEQGATHFGRLDILVNNAGIAVLGGTQDLSVPDWDRILDINLKAVFMTTKHALPYLKQSPAGRIINIASVNSFRGGLGPAYTASKAGVMNLTRDLAVEVGAAGVTANAICPGAIETAVQDFLGDAAEKLCEAIQSVTPIRRLGIPRDIGRACVFLASDDAAWITGIALPVDGGLLSGWTMKLD